ncbi:MAG: A24 family peptidase C-terminal domain-containing protein [Candidatus Hodarchaeota archaeon]
MQLEQSLLEITSILIIISVLGYTAWLDWKYRRVSNKIWTYPTGASLVILLARTYLNFDYLLFFFISVGATFLLVFILFSIGAFGGADGKALLSVSLVLPIAPNLMGNLQTLPIFAVSVFNNMVILLVVSSIWLLVWNIVTSKPLYNPFEGFEKEKLWRRVLTLLTCHRTSISKIRGKKHIRVREVITNDDLYLKTFTKKECKNETTLELLENYKKEKGFQSKVWVSSPIPLILFALVAFIMTFTLGDIILMMFSFIFA